MEKMIGKFVACIEVDNTNANTVKMMDDNLDYMVIDACSPIKAKMVFEQLLADIRKTMIVDADKDFTVDMMIMWEPKIFKAIATCIHSLGVINYKNMVNKYINRPYYHPVFCSPIFAEMICDVFDIVTGIRQDFTRGYIG